MQIMENTTKLLIPGTEKTNYIFHIYNLSGAVGYLKQFLVYYNVSPITLFNFSYQRVQVWLKTVRDIIQNMTRIIYCKRLMESDLSFSGMVT